MGHGTVDIGQKMVYSEVGTTETQSIIGHAMLVTQCYQADTAADLPTLESYFNPNGVTTKDESCSAQGYDYKGYVGVGSYDATTEKFNAPTWSVYTKNQRFGHFMG